MILDITSRLGRLPRRCRYCLAVVTQVYAERDLEKAIKIMREIG